MTTFPTVGVRDRANVTDTQTRAASAADKKAARIAVAKAKADATKQAAAEVEVEGKQLAAIVKRMRAMELGSGKLMGEATDELRKADTLRAEISKRLAAVKPKCKAAGMSFKDFQKQYCPNYSRTAIYRMLAIGHSPDPDAAVEAERQAERERKAEAAKNRPGNSASGTSDVRLANGQPLDTSKLSPAVQEQLARVTGNGVHPEDSARAMDAKLAGEKPASLEPMQSQKLAAEAPLQPQMLQAGSAEEISDGHLLAFKKACDAHYTSELLPRDRAKARMYFTALSDKLTKLERKAA